MKHFSMNGTLLATSISTIFVGLVLTQPVNATNHELDQFGGDNIGTPASQVQNQNNSFQYDDPSGDSSVQQRSSFQYDDPSGDSSVTGGPVRGSGDDDIDGGPVRPGGTDDIDGGAVNQGGSNSLINPLGGISSIPQLLLKILDIILIFAVPIIVFFIIWAGFLYVTARGNDSQITKAHAALAYAVIGGVIVLGAKVLLEVIQGTVNALK